MSAEKNAITERLLQQAGFELESEPSWVVKGEVPDFFATGPAELWVEVKAIDDPERFQLLQERARWLWQRAAKVPERGSASAWISGEATERHVKAAISLAREALQLWEENPGRADRVSIIVPHDANFSRRVYLMVPTVDGTELLICVSSRSGKYGRPQVGHELNLDNRAVLVESEGGSRTEDALALGLHEDNFLVALMLEHSEAPFAIHHVMPTGPGHRLTTTQTVRIAAKKANSQFKNACRYRRAVCLLFIFEDGPLVQEPRPFAAAFYGDLQIEYDPRNFSNGRVVFGRNGVWSPSANRTTSAVCLVRNNGGPLIMRNIWATTPLPTAIFGWPEISIGADGTVEFPR